jgi:Glycosyl hydrolase family 26
MRRLLPLLLAIACPLAFAPSALADGAWGSGDSKSVCAYGANSIARFNAFSALVGRDINCALVYNDASPDWAGWETPWFLYHSDPNYNWRKWKTAPGTGRHLIITQNLFPSSENNLDWRHMGANGDYEAHARALAQNLVATGLGDSIIRLGHEANGTWYPDSIGSTQEDFDLWKQFWRRTVLAMRSVPGANFRFDWCVNAGVRPIPLDAFYPGDDVVDIVGIDAYDAGVPTNQPDRWNYLYTRTDGIRDVERFAAAHGKPMSIPEWGVGPASSNLSGGDDAAYVDGIARVVRDNRLAYQAYFYNYDWATQLATGPLSLAAYIAHFGIGGDSLFQAVAPPPPVSAPPAPAPTPDTPHPTPPAAHQPAPASVAVQAQRVAKAPRRVAKRHPVKHKRRPHHRRKSSRKRR